jgi:hypothetical protein
MTTYANNDQPGRAAPPQEPGRCLATFKRPGSRGRSPERLRVVLDQYEGHNFISVRAWVQDRQGGGWWPTKRGVRFG